MNVAQAPAKLTIRSLKEMTQKQRNDIKREGADIFQNIWNESDKDVNDALDRKDINKANKTWCYVGEEFLWII